MLRNLVLGWCFCLLILGTALAQGPVVEFEGRYWMTNLSADAKLTQAGQGTDINLKSDLDIGDKNFPSGRINFFLGQAHRLTLDYTPISYNTDSNLRRPVDFGGETYTVNTRVIGKLDLQYYRFGWAYQFVNLEGGIFKFGTLLEIKGVRGEVALAAPNLGIDNSWNFSAWLPTVGVAMDINPTSFLNFFAAVSGLPAGQYGTLWEVEAGVKFIPFKYLSVSGGYRLVNIEARNDPDYAKVRLGGPYLGLSLRF
jgi:hypothetical protein